MVDRPEREKGRPKKIKKMLDKLPIAWYNQVTNRAREGNPMGRADPRESVRPFPMTPTAGSLGVRYINGAAGGWC